MNGARLVIPAGESRDFEIAGVRARFTSASATAPVVLAGSYLPFSTASGDVDFEVHVACCNELPKGKGSLIYDSNLHWRALVDGAVLRFELVHPPTSRVYCRAEVSPDFSSAEVLFSREAFSEHAKEGGSVWEFPYPLEQLLLVPVLARRDVLLLHATGAVLSNGAAVFAGHSGDGKTTLAGILSDEGLPLLSDERVALRKTNNGFVAHGTPWPGEGDVVSNATAPLGAIYVLEKSAFHSIAEARIPPLLTEIVARAIVPYYLPDIATRILDLFVDLSTRVRLRKLSFARRPGLKALLQAA